MNDRIISAIPRLAIAAIRKCRLIQAMFDEDPAMPFQDRVRDRPNSSVCACPPVSTGRGLRWTSHRNSGQEMGFDSRLVCPG